MERFRRREQALAAVRPDRLAGYDHDQVAPIAFDEMCRIMLWDWPVLYWLRRLEPELECSSTQAVTWARSTGPFAIICSWTKG